MIAKAKKNKFALAESDDNESDGSFNDPQINVPQLPQLHKAKINLVKTGGNITEISDDLRCDIYRYIIRNRDDFMRRTNAQANQLLLRFNIKPTSDMSNFLKTLIYVVHKNWRRDPQRNLRFLNPDEAHVFSDEDLLPPEGFLANDSDSNDSPPREPIVTTTITGATTGVAITSRNSAMAINALPSTSSGRNGPSTSTARTSLASTSAASTTTGDVTTCTPISIDRSQQGASSESDVPYGNSHYQTI